jgi:hypothetical protein
MGMLLVLMGILINFVRINSTASKSIETSTTE